MLIQKVQGVQLALEKANAIQLAKIQRKEELEGKQEADDERPQGPIQSTMYL